MFGADLGFYTTSHQTRMASQAGGADALGDCCELNGLMVPRLRASNSLLADVIGNIDAGNLMEVDGAEQEGWIHITRIDDQPVDGWARHSIGANSAVVGQHLASSSTMMTNPWDQTLHDLFNKCALHQTASHSLLSCSVAS